MADQLLAPKSDAALLAEEWTIDPRTPLPSFVEMKLIEEASKCGHDALKSLFEMLVGRMVIRTQQWDDHLPRLKQICAKLADALGKFGAEWRFAILYYLERYSLRASSATLAESLYATKRAAVRVNDEGQRDQWRVEPIDRKNSTRLALLLALGPYLNEKVNVLLEGKPALYMDPSKLSAPHRRLMKRVLQLLKAGIQMMNFQCQWRFLLGQSLHFDAISLCLRLIVRRQTQQDQVTSAAGPELKPEPAADTLPPKFMTSDTRFALVSLGSAALLASWANQMRASWRDYETMRNTVIATTERVSTTSTEGNTTDGSLPPPPHMFHEPSFTRRGRCPKCKRTLLQPVVNISDYQVCCQKCLEEKPSSSLDEYIRLYEPISSGNSDADEN